MAEHDFFKLLRKKIEVEPSRAAEREFWRKFENEFAPPRRRFFWMPAYAFAVAALVLAGTALYLRAPSSLPELMSEEAELLALAGDADLLQNLEFYDEIGKEFDDEIPIDEEDWKILLPEDETT